MVPTLLTSKVRWNPNERPVDPKSTCFVPADIHFGLNYSLIPPFGASRDRRCRAAVWRDGLTVRQPRGQMLVTAAAERSAARRSSPTPSPEALGSDGE